MSEDKRQEHVSRARRLQDLLLQKYEEKLLSGDLSDTGMAALQKLLLANGWDFDESNVPEELKDQLTSHVDPESLEDTDEDVLDIRRRMSG